MCKMKTLFFSCLVFAAYFCLVPNVTGQSYQHNEAFIKNRQQFSDAKFGVMLHIGLYTQLMGGGDLTPAEWILRDKKIPQTAYDQLQYQFNPWLFNADSIIDQLYNAGARYLNFTIKHADGFVLYNSKYTDYKVSNTPFKRDMLEEINKACERKSMPLFLHYYQFDMHSNDYALAKQFCEEEKTGTNEAWNRVLEEQNNQLSELLTNYKAVSGLWLNGYWDLKDKVDWQFEKTYSMLHQSKLGLLIANNHHLGLLPGEDFNLYYKKLPGEPALVPSESFCSINNSWGYNLADTAFMSAHDIIEHIVKSAAYNSNFMLNVALMPNGQLPPQVSDILAEVGVWFKKNGEAIYATQSGSVQLKDQLVSTQRQHKVYVHFLQAPGKRIELNLDQKIKSAYLLNNHEKISFKRKGSIVSFDLRKVPILTYETILVLELE